MLDIRSQEKINNVLYSSVIIVVQPQSRAFLQDTYNIGQEFLD
jgi:hypothetical protein